MPSRRVVGSGKPLPKFIYVDDFADASEAAVRVRAGASLKRKFSSSKTNPISAKHFPEFLRATGFEVQGAASGRALGANVSKACRE